MGTVTYLLVCQVEGKLAAEITNMLKDCNTDPLSYLTLFPDNVEVLGTLYVPLVQQILNSNKRLTELSDGRVSTGTFK